LDFPDKQIIKKEDAAGRQVVEMGFDLIDVEASWAIGM